MRASMPQSPIGQEAIMCHAVRVTLSPAETRQVRKLHGILAPIYASVALLLLAVAMLSHGPRSGDAVAVADNAAATAASPATR